MPIFQKSIVDKYLGTLEVDVLNDAYNSYKEVYGAQKIKRIRKLKEEQYQGGFLKDIFGSVLGYTIDPEVGYNIELEKKNETNAKKADGAILKEEKVLGVIELKSNSTKNLESIKDQAFGYKNNHKGCKYVISSNFHKLRFYIDDATEYEEFDLYNLDKDTFKKFFLYLRKEGLLDKNIPKLLKEETKFHEENISKQLYKDYSAFKNKFFENIVKNNPQYDKLLLFKKSQKFLDRILFILFAEDKGLIPTNAISRIVESWALADEMHQKSLYELLRILFSHLNVGHTYKSGYEIPPYNGGLFAPDEVLDKIRVDDAVLKDDLLTLSKYDFNTDVDVNILGHIFEHSLTEIEEIEAKIKGEEADKSKGKRKKDGVFYTPKYITKYIVDNTVGKLCSEKKEELGLDIDFDVLDYQKSNGTVNAKGKELFHTLESYKKWLLTLKILDPACGSGAFLNQALSFLIEEHKNVDDLIADLTNTPLRIFDTDKAILENNIFGVDINDESVEIAKLSLWLRTAQKGRKLSNLNNNIKCGNSLIDDPAVAGDKAFKWEEEFPEIFANGGFDVVIGNPPYGATLDGKNWLKNRYKETSFGNIDSYKYFIQLGTELLINKGVLSYIMPDSYLEKEYFKDLRVFTSNNFGIITNIKMGDDVFEEVNLPTSIIILNKKGRKTNNYYFLDISKTSETEKSNSLVNGAMFITDKPKSEETFIVIESIIKSNNTVPLIEVYDQVMGVKTYQNGKGKPKQTHYEKEGDVFVSNHLDDTYNYPYVSQGINRYSYQSQNEFISYGEWLAEPRKKKYFDNPKVIIREIINPRIFATYIEEPGVVKNIAAVIVQKDKLYPIKFLLGLINSKLFTHYVNEQSPKSGNKSYPSFNSRLLKQLPIIKCNDVDKTKVINKVSIILEQTEKSILNRAKFSNYIRSQFSIEKLTKKLQNWDELELGEFIKELSKAIKKAGCKKLTKMDEMEWMEVFESKKSEALELKAKIDQTDKEIDQMVYQLYGLTEEEIKTVKTL